MHNYKISYLYFIRRHQLFSFILPHPYFFGIERHAPRKIADRLLMRPIFQQFTNTQQEHDRSGRIEVASQDRNGNSCRIQHRHFDLTGGQTLYTHPDISYRFAESDSVSKRHRQKNLVKESSKDPTRQFFLEFCIELSAGILQNFHRHVDSVIVKCGQCINQLFSAAVETDHSISGTLIYLD